MKCMSSRLGTLMLEPCRQTNGRVDQVLREAVTKVKENGTCLETCRNFLYLNNWITSRHKRPGVAPTGHQREGIVAMLTW